MALFQLPLASVIWQKKVHTNDNNVILYHKEFTDRSLLATTWLNLYLLPGIQGLVADPPDLSVSQECLSTFEQELLGQLYNVFLILVKKMFCL